MSDAEESEYMFDDEVVVKEDVDDDAEPKPWEKAALNFSDGSREVDIDDGAPPFNFGFGDNLGDLIWNPSDILTGAMTMSTNQIEAEVSKQLESLTLTPEQKRKLAFRSILEHLLDLSQPVMDEPLKKMLEKDDNLSVFLDYIVQPLSAEQISSSPPTAESHFDPRDNYPDVVALKRSYHVMTLLRAQHPAIKDLIMSKLSNILNKLFEVFNITSAGNFHHFCGAFEAIFRVTPVSVINHVFTAPNASSVQRRKSVKTIGSPAQPQTEWEKINAKESEEAPVMKMARHSHRRPVGEALLVVIFPTCPTPRAASKRKQRFEFLNSCGFWEEIVKPFRSKNHSGAVEGSAEFISRLVEEAIRTEDSAILFDSLVKDPKGIEIFIQNIANEREDETSTALRNSSIDALNSLLFKSPVIGPSELSEIQRSVNNGVEKPSITPTNHLSSVSQSLKQNLAQYLPILCETIMKPLPQAEVLEVKLSGHKVRQAFTYRRLSCLRFIQAALSESSSLVPPILNEIPPSFWKYLVRSFFEYRFNDMLHCILVKLFSSIFTSNHVPTLSALLSSTKMVTNMLQTLKAPDATGIKGHILALCARLEQYETEKAAAGGDGDDYLFNMLKCHAAWRAYLSERREESSRKTTITFPVTPLVPKANLPLLTLPVSPTKGSSPGLGKKKKQKKKKKKKKKSGSGRLEPSNSSDPEPQSPTSENDDDYDDEDDDGEDEEEIENKDNSPADH